MKPFAIAVLAATSLSSLAHAEATDGGCFVTLSPEEATKGIRHWRAPSSCVEWYSHMAKLRPLQANPGEAPWVHVVVQEINLPASRITVSHGAIPQIRMPAMRINFPVADSAQLAMLHKGDEVDIQCEHRGGVVRVVNFRI